MLGLAAVDHSEREQTEQNRTQVLVTTNKEWEGTDRFGDSDQRHRK